MQPITVNQPGLSLIKNEITDIVLVRNPDIKLANYILRVRHTIPSKKTDNLYYIAHASC